MEVGLLTAPFGRKSLEDVVKWSGAAGFDALEVATSPGSNHIDPYKVDRKRAAGIGKLLEANHIRISSLASYRNMTEADPKARKQALADVRKAVDAAVHLGVDVVCTLAGMPVPGKSKLQTIEEDCPKAFRPLCEYAAKKKVQIALENWFATNLQGLDTFERLFDVCPYDNFGLNFDPSHLVHQQIDYLCAVERFKDRIFHTHAKDTEINQSRLRWIGNQARGWWRYVIPGYGVIDWGPYIAVLRRCGFNGVLSIEHEDGALGVEEGFVKGLEHLRQFA